MRCCEIVPCLFSVHPQGGGDTIPSLAVGEESQLLPGQQEEEERRVHGRCSMVWLPRGTQVCSGELVAASGITHSPPSVLYAGRAWALAQEAEVAVGLSHMEALKGSCSKPCASAPLPSAVRLSQLGIWDQINVHEPHGHFCIPGGRATSRSQAGNPRHGLPAVPIL